MPLRETAGQGRTFLSLIYAGMAIALLYDLATPALNSRSFFAHLIADLLLCAAGAALCLAALHITGCGQLRLYMPLPLILGAAIYRLGLRALFSLPIKILRQNRSLPNRSE